MLATSLLLVAFSTVLHTIVMHLVHEREVRLIIRIKDTLSSDPAKRSVERKLIETLLRRVDAAPVRSPQFILPRLSRDLLVPSTPTGSQPEGALGNQRSRPCRQ